MGGWVDGTGRNSAASKTHFTATYAKDAKEIKPSNAEAAENAEQQSRSQKPCHR
jgi:hypothetical protein